MNIIKKLLLTVALAGLTAAFMTGCACDKCNMKTSAQAKAYPLDHCLVSGEKFGDMGKTYTMDYQGQAITFCCKDCVKDFNKDPEKYMQKLSMAQGK